MSETKVKKIELYRFSEPDFASGVKIPAGRNHRVMARSTATGVNRIPKRAGKLWARLEKAGADGIPLPDNRTDRWLVRCLLKLNMVRIEVEKPGPKAVPRAVPKPAARPEATAATA